MVFKIKDLLATQVDLAADGAGVAGAVREPVQVLHEELPVRHLTRYTGGSAIRIRA